jgi:hypothetical protein
MTSTCGPAQSVAVGLKSCPTRHWLGEGAPVAGGGGPGVSRRGQGARPQGPPDAGRSLAGRQGPGRQGASRQGCRGRATGRLGSSARLALPCSQDSRCRSPRLVCPPLELRWPRREDAGAAEPARPRARGAEGVLSHRSERDREGGQDAVCSLLSRWIDGAKNTVGILDFSAHA